MSKFKGTKGKWVLKAFPKGKMSVRNESDTKKICVPIVENHDEALANLLLISKAPEMLQMLQEIARRFDIINSHPNGIVREALIYNISIGVEQLIKEATEL
jgi:hypothetical protein